MPARIEGHVYGKHVALLQTPDGEARPGPAGAPERLWEVYIDGRLSSRAELLRLLEWDLDPKHDHLREVVGATRR
jgi:hypothetical protein